jgi:DNA-binding MarR family transcriptional regulator
MLTYHMSDALSFNLHLLTSRMDRLADRILQAEVGLSYSRFMVLFMVQLLKATTQRALSEKLGVTEPSVSRMTVVLVEAKFLRVNRDPSGGNRRQLTLSPEGQRLVQRCTRLLEGEFIKIVEASRVPLNQYLRHTKLLVASLDEFESNANA